MELPSTACLAGSPGETISILVVVEPERSPELARLLSHTNWRIRVVHSITEAARALRSFQASVILCQHRLPDGAWLDLNPEDEAAQIVVMAPGLDGSLWLEVLNGGAFDLLSMPIHAPELYSIVAMAWRRSRTVAEAMRARHLSSRAHAE